MLVCSCRGSRGRQAFVFARFPNNLGMVAFHVFQAIPFLYELRELLDWCAAPRLTCVIHIYHAEHSRKAEVVPISGTGLRLEVRAQVSAGLLIIFRSELHELLGVFQSCGDSWHSCAGHARAQRCRCLTG